MKRAAALLSFLVFPFAEETETAPIGFDTAVQQLRSAVGLWDVETTQFADDGAIARVACGTYKFDWVVPDRVLAGRSDIPDWKEASGILFYVNQRRSTIEMASVGADGHLWIMSGPAGGETRTTPPTALTDGGTMQLRFTRFNVTANRFESRMEVSTDGGSNWKPGNHQVFRRAVPSGASSAGGLRFRRRPQPYVPLT
jgi:hypothetical protein